MTQDPNNVQFLEYVLALAKQGKLRSISLTLTRDKMDGDPPETTDLGVYHSFSAYNPALYAEDPHRATRVMCRNPEPLAGLPVEAAQRGVMVDRVTEVADRVREGKTQGVAIVELRGDDFSSHFVACQPEHKEAMRKRFSVHAEKEVRGSQPECVAG